MPLAYINYGRLLDLHNGKSELISFKIVVNEPPHIFEIKFTPDYKANESIFWLVFNDLSNNNNDELVAYDKLQERLISTGKLDAGGSVLIIEHMEKLVK